MVTHHWDRFIIVSHLTCWGLQSPHHLKVNAESCSHCGLPLQTKTRRQPRGSRSSSCMRIAVPHAKCLSKVSTAAHMLFSYCRLTALTSERAALTYTLHKKKKNPPETSFKVSSGTYQSGGPFMFLLNQTGRQTAHFRLHHACPGLQSWAPGRRSAKCGENRSSRGKHVSTGQL